MTLTTLFSAYTVLVASAAAVAVLASLRRRSAVTIAAIAVALGYAALLGRGALARADAVPPAIALLAGPVVLGVLLTTLTRPGAFLARHLALRLLLGFQLFRIGVEATLQHLANSGLAPRIMTLAGGNVEILVAATAPIAAWLSTRGPTGRTLAWTWNVIGLASLANVVIRAVLSAPGPLQFIHAEVADRAILIYPFTFIPGFMAPLALALHLLAFRAFRASPAVARSTR